jgi:peptidoglycan/xylan/chitin deacetylase (PgdA/CDA1 family)
MKIMIVLYHYVRENKRSKYPGMKSLDVAHFREQLDFLKTKFRFIRIQDMIEALETGKAPDTTEHSVLLTFDDGYLDHYTTVFPILDDMGIQGSFFPPSAILETEKLLDASKIQLILSAGGESNIYKTLIEEINTHRGSEFKLPDTQDLLSNYAKPYKFDNAEIRFIKQMLQTILPERLRRIILENLFQEFVGVSEAVLSRDFYCDISQLTTMKKHGMHIGLHGSRHGWLGNMSSHDYEQDISHALSFMDSLGLLNKKEWVISYPFGSWNDGVIDYIRKNGCSVGLTVEVNVADLFVHNRLLLPRLDTVFFPPRGDRYRDFLQ